MRLVLQRVQMANVHVGREKVASIDKGLLVFVGIEKGDTLDKVDLAVRKLSTLRLFEDATGRMNLDASTAGAAFLIVSQFTLAANMERGRRPSFDSAEVPTLAAPMIEKMANDLKELGYPVETGHFGAHMEVGLINDGPVTFVLDL